MKIILVSDVAKVGRRHEVKEVADGFGRNFIIARGLGVAATPANLAKLKTWQAQATGEAALQRALLTKLEGQLDQALITIKAKANPSGHLFAQIHPSEIAAALAAQLHLNIKPEQIILPTPIKQVGEHEVKIKLGDQTTSTRLTVESRPS